MSARASTARESWLPAMPITKEVAAIARAKAGRKAGVPGSDAARAGDSTRHQGDEDEGQRSDDRDEEQPALDVVAVHVPELVCDDRTSLALVEVVDQRVVEDDLLGGTKCRSRRH